MVGGAYQTSAAVTHILSDKELKMFSLILFSLQTLNYINKKRRVYIKYWITRSNVLQCTMGVQRF